MGAHRTVHGACLALAVLGVALLVPAARAATLVQQGWWNRLPIVVGAPVGEDQLLVEGAPDDAVAVAAVRFTLAEGQVAETLVLPVAEQQLQPDAVVVACGTSSSWKPAQGGDWETRPTPACERAVEGVLGDEGSSWSFAVASLQDGDVLDVVLLPAPNTTMRVVFEPVTTSALRVSDADPAPTSASPELPDDSSAADSDATSAAESPAASPSDSSEPSDTFDLPPPIADSGSSSTAEGPSTAEAVEVSPVADRDTPVASRTPELPGDLAAAPGEDSRASSAGLLALLGAAALAFVALRRGKPGTDVAAEGSSAAGGDPAGASAVGLPAAVAVPSPAPAKLGDPLVAESVSVHFGGVRALQDVSIRVGPGEIVGLIGGNGAGKTTFMDCVSGYVIPDEGSITTFGQELLGSSPEMRPYLDVARGYQSARLYPGLTVEETLLVALERTQPTGVLAALLRLRRGREAEAAKRERADEVIETLGLTSYRDNRVGELSTGTRRVLDVACMLAQEPKLLLLDEPTAGLAQRETEAFGPLLKRLQRQLGCAILIIEHDIVLISSVCDRVYALETGRVLAEGDPDTVRQDPRVVASYLGTDDAAIFRSGSERPTAPVRPRRAPLRAPAPAALDELNRDELLRRATESGVTGRHRMRKSELVDALSGS